MKAKKKKLLDWFVYLIVRVIICVVQALPIKVCDQIAKFLAFLAVDLIRIRAKLIEKNLSHVFPKSTVQQRKTISRRMWRHLALMVFEIAHAPRKIHETNWRRYFKIRRSREIVRNLLLERPKALVSGHYGNFELGGFVTGLLGFPGYTVARQLDNHYLHQFFKSFREKNGQFILDTAGSSNAIQEQLENNQCLTLLGDQHTELGAIWIDFLGRPAACHKSLALFTLSCDAPMVAVVTKRAKKYANSTETEPMQFEIDCSGTVDPQELPEEINGVRDLTLWYNGKLEEIILEQPDQYWWVHNRWKPRPKKTRKRKSIDVAA